jgi:hypothetical protein
MSDTVGLIHAESWSPERVEWNCSDHPFIPDRHRQTVIRSISSPFSSSLMKSIVYQRRQDFSFKELQETPGSCSCILRKLASAFTSKLKRIVPLKNTKYLVSVKSLLLFLKESSVYFPIA